ncbi:hypothetical protein DYU11_20895 [Fibrisoma montanum]|uniref:Uncharacterized protein n=1 Tax=Fibrisoma montanum TaxID=2305895 RepID=A0A418M3W4_9BACT|nr:hypothetical protein [Fibrisoma montanum]RIV20505.1 hypothetical protein DYU11_20895 [Fibrisoma montanum]
MTYKTALGEEIEGSSPTEIIDAMKAGGRFSADQDRPAYMTGFAERLKEWNGEVLTYSDEKSFVEELLRVGYLTPAK